VELFPSQDAQKTPSCNRNWTVRGCGRRDSKCERLALTAYVCRTFLIHEPPGDGRFQPPPGRENLMAESSFSPRSDQPHHTPPLRHRIIFVSKYMVRMYFNPPVQTTPCPPIWMLPTGTADSGGQCGSNHRRNRPVGLDFGVTILFKEIKYELESRGTPHRRLQHNSEPELPDILPD
jgi:hypothetical protein